MRSSRRGPIALIVAIVAIAPSRAIAKGEPLEWGTRAASKHAPYAEGSCTTCHDRKGPYPGPPANNTEELCYSCHENVKKHSHAFARCQKCHNAHDSQHEHLLHADVQSCTGCHRANT